MAKTLITGATGGLGSAVADFLKAKAPELDIAVLVRNPEADAAQSLAKKGFEIRVADYDDKAALLKAFDGIEVLYFVSGSDIGARDPQHKNVVEAAKESGIGHVFYTSVSLDGLSEEAPLYGAMKTHFQTEQWIQEAGLNYTFLRHNLYSEVIAMFLGAREQILASKTVFFPAGEGKTAFVPRAELAEAGATALADPSAHVNKAYELNGSEKVTFAQIASALTEVLGEEIGYVSPAIPQFQETLEQAGVPAEYIGMMSTFGQGIAEGAFDTPSSDLEPLLGRSSQPVKDFLAQVYA